MLITLTIIGVIAALTIPTLMTKYQQHVFANQFKKSLYTISQLVARTRSELGASKLGSYCSEYSKNNGGYYNSKECAKTINELLLKTSSKKQYAGSGTVFQIKRNNDVIKTYNNKKYLTYLEGALNPIFYVSQLPDGSFIGTGITGGNVNFGVDLNGNKKPNRLGYDVFIFSLNRKNDTISGFRNDAVPSAISDSDAADYANKNFENNSLKNYYEQTYGNPCNLESTREGNGIGCAYFALRNKCPYDETKTYWECLK